MLFKPGGYADRLWGNNLSGNGGHSGTLELYTHCGTHPPWLHLRTQAQLYSFQHLHPMTETFRSVAFSGRRTGVCVLLADHQQFFTGKLYVPVQQLKLPAEELLGFAPAMRLAEQSSMETPSC
ncbi:hypothetical protein GN956_G24644 [Arapaima gigas]